MDDTFLDILQEGVARNASDIHFRSGESVWYRVDGQITPGSPIKYNEEELEKLLFPTLPPLRKEVFLKNKTEVDYAWEIEGLARFRINLYYDLQGLAGCFRILPAHIMDANELNLEQGILELCGRTKGLILVTGPTGSGKSTTMASMVDYINMMRAEHIITVEDPIEFKHKEKRSLINCREITTHTESFSRALRASLREDPDVVLVGEMRDLETTMTALEVAETGHLVFSTLHTNDAASTVYRIINQFPKRKQEQVRIALAASLIGVITQNLLPRAHEPGRIAVREIMIVNNAISNLIRENKIYQLGSIIQMNKRLGMQKMEDSLLELVQDEKITAMEALERAPDADQFKKNLIARGLF